MAFEHSMFASNPLDSCGNSVRTKTFSNVDKKVNGIYYTSICLKDKLIRHLSNLQKLVKAKLSGEVGLQGLSPSFSSLLSLFPGHISLGLTYTSVQGTVPHLLLYSNLSVAYYIGKQLIILFQWLILGLSKCGIKTNQPSPILKREKRKKYFLMLNLQASVTGW